MAVADQHHKNVQTLHSHKQIKHTSLSASFIATLPLAGWPDGLPFEPSFCGCQKPHRHKYGTLHSKPEAEVAQQQSNLTSV